MREFNDLRLLSVFVAVYQQKGISAAARVLNISQPSVSRSIQRLEDELGVSLFDRSSSGIVATEFAARLYRRALSIIDELDSIHADAKRLGESRRRLINVGSGLGCWMVVCDALVAYRAQEPDVVFNVTIASARALVNLAEAGELDVLVGNSDTLRTATWLTSHDVFDTQLYLLARAAHPVFDYDSDEQLDRIGEYPSSTYHMLEHAHGTRMSGSAVLRANDYLFLMQHALATDAYLIAGHDMLELAESFGLRAIGGRATGATSFAVAWPREHATEDARALAASIRRFAPGRVQTQPAPDT